MGTGSYFQLARTTSMYVASGGVGLQEGGRTHTRLLNNKKNASIADQQIKELQASLKKGIIGKNYFDKSPIQLQLKNIKKFNAAQRKYEVKFNQHDGEIPYVAEFFKDRALGTVYNSYNKKIISNITIT